MWVDPTHCRKKCQGSKPNTKRQSSGYGYISKLHTPNQTNKTGNAHTQIQRLGHHGGGHMHIHNAKAVALLIVSGRKGNTPNKAHGQQQQSGHTKKAHPVMGDLIKPARRPKLVPQLFQRRRYAPTQWIVTCMNIGSLWLFFIAFQR